MHWLEVLFLSIGLIGSIGVCWTAWKAYQKGRRSKTKEEPTTYNKSGTIFGASTIGEPKATYGSDPTKVSTTEDD